MMPDPIFLNIHIYGIMIAIGVLCAFVTLFAVAKKKSIDGKFTDFVFYNGLVSIAVGFGSAAVFQAVYDYIEDPSAGFHFNGGLTFIGGLIGGVICFLLIYAFYRKKTAFNMVTVTAVIATMLLFSLFAVSFSTIYYILIKPNNSLEDAVFGTASSLYWNCGCMLCLPGLC